MERGGWRFVYPPIYEDVTPSGYHVYRVVFNDRIETIVLDPLDPLPWEEAQLTLQRLLRRGLRNGTYLHRDFYVQDDHHDMQLPEESYGQHCFGGVPASDKTIMGLPETSVKEGECSVCLESFEQGNKKLRIMPCSHSFHELCIFNWLRISHVCPLCRFPLPTKQQQEDDR